MKIINDGNASAAEKLRQAIEAGLGEKAKDVQVDASGNSISLTYVTKGAGPVTYSIELEEAEDGLITFNPEQIKALQEKTGEDIGQYFSFLADISDETIEKAVQSSIDEFVEKYGDKMFTNTYLCIFAIIRILQDSAEKLKEAAIEARTSAMQVSIQSIENQAAEEKSAAMTAMFASFIVFGFQATLTLGAGAAKARLAAAKNNAIQNNPGVKLNQQLSSNTELLNKPEAANTAMLDASKGLEPKQTQEIINELGGYGGKPNETAPEGSARAKLEAAYKDTPKAEEAVKETQKTEETKETQKTEKANETPEEKATKETPEEKKAEKAREQAKKEYVDQLDDGVEKYKAKYEKAAQAYERELKSEHPDKAELKRLEGECEQARKEYVFANATRTAALANGPGGKPLLNEDEREFRITVSEAALSGAEEAAANAPELKDLPRKIEWAEAASKAVDNFTTFLGSLPQVVSQRLHAEATIKEKDRTQADEDLTRGQELVQSAKDIQAKLAQMLCQFFQYWGETMRHIAS